MKNQEKKYPVLTVCDGIVPFWDWSRDKEQAKGYACVNVDNWREEGVTGPETHGRVLYLPDLGLDVALWCYEEHPRAVYHNPNDFVHTDSCMEAFINVYPETPEYGYVSVEMNHNGASHCSFGTGRNGRLFVVQKGLPHPEVQITDFEENGRKGWCAHTVIKKTLLEALYERELQLDRGHLMKGNFYKCGDHTDHPHWGSWSKVEKLDFHTPETFGELEVI